MSGVAARGRYGRVRVQVKSVDLSSRITDELVTSPNLRIIVSRASPETFRQSKSYILEFTRMKKHTEFVKGMRMNRKRFARGVAGAAGFSFFFTPPDGAPVRRANPRP